MKSIVKSSIAAALIVLGAAVAAEARPVLVTADLNVRVGPGTEHPSVGVIRGGSTAEVGRCFNGWCEIAWGGLRGFSSQAYLDGFGPPPAPAYQPAPPPPYYAPRPYYEPYYNPYRPYRRWRRHWDD
jgi:SH3-like domain-containing protein